MCLVSPWGEAFLKELVRLHRETGVTYYKWDAVGQYGCDAPGHGHGTAANTPRGAGATPTPSASASGSPRSPRGWASRSRARSWTST